MNHHKVGFRVSNCFFFLILLVLGVFFSFELKAQDSENCDRIYFLDDDGDGFGDPTSTKLVCDQPDGYVENSLDCDDTNAAFHPVESTSGFVRECEPIIKPNLVDIDSWNYMRVEQANIVDDGTNLKMYFRAHVDSFEMSFGLATSEDNGTTWSVEDSSPVYNLIEDSSWYWRGISSPWVIYDEDPDPEPETGSLFSYRMYFHAQKEDGTRAIGLLLSRDGYLWQEADNNPILDVGPSGSFDDTNVHNPTVFIDEEGIYHMFYSAKRGDADYSLAYAVSEDGYRWTKPDRPVMYPPDERETWNSLRLSAPAVNVHDQIAPNQDEVSLELWYAGSHDRLFGSVGYVVASGFSQWQSFSDTAVMVPYSHFDAETTRFDAGAIYAVFPRRVDNGVELYYSTSFDRTTDHSPTYIARAFNQTPVLEINTPTDGSTVTEGVSLTGSVTDTAYDQLYIHVLYDGTPLSPSGFPVNEDGSFDISLTGLPTDLELVTVYALDRGGLWSDIVFLNLDVESLPAVLPETPIEESDGGDGEDSEGANPLNPVNDNPNELGEGSGSGSGASGGIIMNSGGCSVGHHKGFQPIWYLFIFALMSGWFLLRKERVVL